MLRIKVEMKNAPSFLGYSRLDAEITAQTIDHREQIDVSVLFPSFHFKLTMIPSSPLITS
jgi:hypothetical protein